MNETLCGVNEWQTVAREAIHAFFWLGIVAIILQPGVKVIQNVTKKD